ncbi:TPA: hypothetical protein VV745_002263, partial [Streptococcus pneumoniae]|nr:hypothetical protein [Streptococcus pneumoniae]
KTATGWSGPSGNGITIGANGEVTFDHTVAKDGSEVKAKVKNGNSDYSAEGKATDPTKAATPQAPTVTANQTDATLKVTPPTGVDEMRITYIPSGSETSKEIVIK